MRWLPLVATVALARAVCRADTDAPVLPDDENEVDLTAHELFEDEVGTFAAKPLSPEGAAVATPAPPDAPIEPLPEKGAASIENPSWHAAVTGTIEATYDDNIFISRDKQADLIFSVAPAIYAGWGDFRAELMRPEGGLPSRFDRTIDPRSYLYAGYRPRYSVFTDHSSENALTHDGMIRGGHTFSRATLGFEGHIRTLSDPDLDVGDRTNRTIISGLLTAEYSFSTKTKLQTALNFESRDYDVGTDSVETTLSAFLDHQFLPKTNAALGVVLGYLAPSDESAQVYQQVLARVSYHPLSKIFASGTAGLEAREILNEGKQRVNPVFDFGVSYQPNQAQQITVEASRRTINSVSQRGENINLTSVGARVRQRFYQKFYATGFGGYQHAEYQNNLAQSNSTSGRADDFFRFGASFACQFTPAMVAELGYEHQTNISSLDVRDFTRNLTQLKINLQF